uniref:Uncharacterized protein n=1 Tax=Mycena chlorophos TaxID=658473 RepID=A0ABQ0LC33_MYCCL|nr:predicted protein [Mycena chlorophos]
MVHPPPIAQAPRRRLLRRPGVFCRVSAESDLATVRSLSPIRSCSQGTERYGLTILSMTLLRPFRVRAPLNVPQFAPWLPVLIPCNVGCSVGLALASLTRLFTHRSIHQSKDRTREHSARIFRLGLHLLPNNFGPGVLELQIYLSEVSRTNTSKLRPIPRLQQLDAFLGIPVAFLRQAHTKAFITGSVPRSRSLSDEIGPENSTQLRFDAERRADERLAHGCIESHVDVDGSDALASSRPSSPHRVTTGLLREPWESWLALRARCVAKSKHKEDLTGVASRLSSQPPVSGSALPRYLSSFAGSTSHTQRDIDAIPDFGRLCALYLGVRSRRSFANPLVGGSRVASDREPAAPGSVDLALRHSSKSSVHTSRFVEKRRPGVVRQILFEHAKAYESFPVRRIRYLEDISPDPSALLVFCGVVLEPWAHCSTALCNVAHGYTSSARSATSTDDNLLHLGPRNVTRL